MNHIVLYRILHYIDSLSVIINLKKCSTFYSAINLDDRLEKLSLTINKKNVFEEAIINNDLATIKHLNTDYINEGLILSIRAKNGRLIKYFLDKGANDWRKALRTSIKMKNHYLIKLFDAKAEPQTENVHHIVRKAAKRNDMDFIKQLFEKYSFMHEHMYADILYGACQSNNMDLVRYSLQNMLVNNVFTSDTILESAIKYATKNGHLDMVEYLINTTHTQLNFSGCLAEAFEHNQKELIPFFINKQKNNGGIYLHCTRTIGAHANNMNVIKYCLGRGLTLDEEHLYIAAFNGHFDISKFIEEHIKIDKDIMKKTVIHAVMGNRNNIAQYFIDKLSFNYNDWNEIMCTALSYKNYQFLETHLDKLEGTKYDEISVIRGKGRVCLNPDDKIKSLIDKANSNMTLIKKLWHKYTSSYDN